MIKLGAFQLTAKGHGYALSVEKTVEVKEKSKDENGKLVFTPTGEFKVVVDEIGFYPKVEQIINRIVQHELAKTEKTDCDLNAFIKTINALTDALHNHK